MKIRFKKLEDNAKEPTRGTPHANGYDLYSTHNTFIPPGQMKKVRTGIAIELPIGYVADVRPRSGLAFKNCLTIINSPGTVDSDYRGEVVVGLINHGNETVTIAEGDRIAQILVHKAEELEFEEVEELSNTLRGEGGFGHTGK